MTARLLCSRPGAVSIDAQLSSGAQASQRSPAQAADTSSGVRALLDLCTPAIALVCRRACIVLSTGPFRSHRSQSSADVSIFCCRYMRPLALHRQNWIVRGEPPELQCPGRAWHGCRYSQQKPGGSSLSL